MKPILVADCNNYSFDTNNCTKCGRAMPDLCVDFEEMKRKAEAYDRTNAAYEAAAEELTVDPYVAKAARKGRPPKDKQ